VVPILQTSMCFAGAAHDAFVNFKRSYWNLMQVKAECFAGLV
jgi:hypothetical protein